MIKGWRADEVEPRCALSGKGVTGAAVQLLMASVGVFVLLLLDESAFRRHWPWFFVFTPAMLVVAIDDATMVNPHINAAIKATWPVLQCITRLTSWLCVSTLALVAVYWWLNQSFAWLWRDALLVVVLLVALEMWARVRHLRAIATHHSLRFERLQRKVRALERNSQ